MKRKLLLKNKIKNWVRQGLLFTKTLPYSSKTFLAGILFLTITIASYFTLPGKQISAIKHPAILTTDTSAYLENQINILNKLTPLDLTFNNQVKVSINLFVNKRSADLALYLGRSEYYFPIIEAYLDKYNLPLELKYLAVIESGLYPKAESKSGAVGIWQFLYNTCALVDLEVNSYIDERCDIYKSTDAACRYLNYLYQTFNNWELAIAAYNCGPGQIRKAIERSGGKTNFWEIQAYLPLETAKYLPSFIAMNFLFENQKFHNITKTQPNFVFSELDTLSIKGPLHFEQIANVLEINSEFIEELNPMYSKNFIPATEKNHILVLPKSYTAQFINKSEEIYSLRINMLDYSEKIKKQSSTTNKICIIHIVQSGEFFHKLAMKYNCSVENIMSWNKIDTNAIHPGQQLKIWVEPKL